MEPGQELRLKILPFWYRSAVWLLGSGPSREAALILTGGDRKVRELESMFTSGAVRCHHADRWCRMGWFQCLRNCWDFHTQKQARVYTENVSVLFVTEIW